MSYFKRMVYLLCLAFTCLAESPRIVSVEAVPRWPWNGLVDITCNTEGVMEGQCYIFQLKGYDRDRNQDVGMYTISTDGGRTFVNGKVVVPVPGGTSIYRFTLDAAKDCPTLNTTSFSVLVDVKEAYLVVDLTTGISRRSDEAPDLSDDTCRTTELWLCLIPAGTFTMGSPNNELGRSYDEKQHKVTLTQPFYMGIFEVTQKQWELTMGSKPSVYKGDTRPVESVSYNNIRGSGNGAGWPSGGHEVDADSFLGKLRTKTGLMFDLPTEAQWEYACRAGTTTALNSGKNLTDETQCPNMVEVGRYYYNQSDGKGGYENHTKVGSYLPNAWGLYDMHGNVYEWCLDWKTDSYSTKAVTDPQGPDSGSTRVYRGGSWYNRAQNCRSAHRNGLTPSSRGSGFRVVFCP